ncbi:MAG: MmcQ/YjbR family DNA-binding protein [Caulobacteraceae bacterium]
MTPDQARAVIRALPEVEEGFNMGSPFFKVAGKVLTRILNEENFQLGGISADEREMLIDAEPAVFHSTPHFNDARMMLARIETISEDQLRGFMVRRWRELVPKAWLKRPDAP